MMSKKNVMPDMSDEELDIFLGRVKSRPVIGNDTETTPQRDDGEKSTTPESTLQTNDGEIKTTPEPVAESAPDVASVVSDVNEAGNVRAASVPIDSEIPSGAPAPFKSEPPSEIPAPTLPELPSAITAPTAPAQPEPRRPSSKQRKASFEEYREAFLQSPKISDRQPVFLSRMTRNRLDEIVRKLGDRKMSVSGLIENLARQHLETYAEDIEVWKRL